MPAPLFPRRSPIRLTSTQRLGIALALVFSSTFALAPVQAQSARDVQSENGQVTLNFVDADLAAVVRALGHFTGTTFLIDPRVQGDLTLVSEQPVSRDVAYRMLLGALRMQGYAVVEDDGIARVVPEADAKLQGSDVATGAARVSGDQLITRVFQLEYENAANLVPVLRPMISPNNPINAYSGNNTLVITDYASNLNRIAEVIDSIDTPTATDTDVVRLRHAVAIDLADQLNRLLNTGSNDATQRVVVVAEPRSNSLMIRSASPARTELARKLIRELDTPEAGASNMHVVTLRNAEAVRLAEVLRGVLTGQGGESVDTGLSSSASGSAGLGGTDSGMGTGMSAGMGSGSGSALGALTGRNTTGGSSEGVMGDSAQGGSRSFSGGGANVHADPTTNTLIITASPPIYRNLRAIIEQLDVRRPQVFVESLIVEIISSDAAEFGIQWMAGLGNVNSSGVRGIGGTSFGGQGSNILGIAANPASIGQGLTLGVVDGTVNLPGVGRILNLGFLARALESRGNANILSTPNLLTLNNEEAHIMVGQNIPFPTGQYTQPGIGGVNPFQTIERQDVGLQLRIRPQVSEGGTIKLAIHQEVSSVDASATAVSSDLGVVTNKREVNTNVLVDDGQIIVLGGLLEDSVSGNREQVPGLGDIPLLGNLFRYDTRSRTKTNLMIFLRPYIVRDADATRITAQRYDLMRELQPQNMPPDHWLLPDLGLPTLPPRVAGEGDILPASASRTAAGDAMVVPQDPAAIYSSRGSNIILAESVAGEAQAEQAMDQIQRAGFAPYVQVVRRDGNPYYQIYVRAARDAASTDTVINALRQLGFRPELLVRP